MTAHTPLTTTDRRARHFRLVASYSAASRRALHTCAVAVTLLLVAAICARPVWVAVSAAWMFVAYGVALALRWAAMGHAAKLEAMRPLCPLCHDLFMLPGDPLKGGDVMNTPCPRCNEWAQGRYQLK